MKFFNAYNIWYFSLCVLFGIVPSVRGMQAPDFTAGGKYISKFTILIENATQQSVWVRLKNIEKERLAFNVTEIKPRNTTDITINLNDLITLKNSFSLRIWGGNPLAFKELGEAQGLLINFIGRDGKETDGLTVNLDTLNGVIERFRAVESQAGPLGQPEEMRSEDRRILEANEAPRRYDLRIRVEATKDVRAEIEKKVDEYRKKLEEQSQKKPNLKARMMS